MLFICWWWCSSQQLQLFTHQRPGNINYTCSRFISLWTIIKTRSLWSLSNRLNTHLCSTWLIIYYKNFYFSFLILLLPSFSIFLLFLNFLSVCWFFYKIIQLRWAEIQQKMPHLHHQNPAIQVNKLFLTFQFSNLVFLLSQCYLPLSFCFSFHTKVFSIFPLAFQLHLVFSFFPSFSQLTDQLTLVYSVKILQSSVFYIWLYLPCRDLLV